MKLVRFLFWAVLSSLPLGQDLLAQGGRPLGERLEQLMVGDSLDRAWQLLEEGMGRHRALGEYLELADLVLWTGKLELEAGRDFPKARGLAREVIEKSPDPLARFRAQFLLSQVYNQTGDAPKAFELGGKALELAHGLDDPAPRANARYALGEYALRMGDLDLFGRHTRAAHALLLAYPERDFEHTARILNYMGALMYLTQKPDSASLYYRQALTKVELLGDSPENRLYFPAAVKANLVLLEQQQGHLEKAMELAKECIVLNQRFLQIERHPLRYRAQRNLSLAYRNLCALYDQLGDSEKALQLAQIAYDHAKYSLGPKEQEYFSAITLLAEAYISLKEFDRAIEIMDEAESALEAMEGDNLLFRANLHGTLGMVYYGQGLYGNAAEHYRMGDEFHRRTQAGSFNSDHMFTLIYLGLSQAHLGNREASLGLLGELYDRGNGSGRHGQVLVTALARANYLLGDYPNCLKWTQHYGERFREGSLDEDLYLPEIILLSAKSRYALAGDRDSQLLGELSQSMDRSLQILEERKSLLATSANVGRLLEENMEIFDFAKQLNLELYQLSSQEAYMDRILQLHESSIYNRIRSRLSLNSRMSYLNVPDSIVQMEAELRARLDASTGEDGEGPVERFEAWREYLALLEREHPQYYRMRFGNLIAPWEKIRSNLAQNTSLLRYFFIGDSLFVHVDNGKDRVLRGLDFGPVREQIQVLGHLENGLDRVSGAAYGLYQALWRPVEQWVTTENVIIFPDRELFNLSFGLLTPHPIASYRDFGRYGLLAKHNISYNYSMLMLTQGESILEFDGDFIAFAPEFDQGMKQRYTMAIVDSIDLDRTYLGLLPQPFNTEVIEKFGRTFHGQVYRNERASKQLFSQRAREHKIIHIATHAESNNANPELSRLVFAKNTTDSIHMNDNYLHLHEIYNQNLASKLAVLTACETGKPSYQPGEGMISLAHAFNYAGSESILTSLWQIDEKSSSEILDLFYRYLAQGEPKDRAIRLAKLDYLDLADGRTLHPQYWAGLILMGDVAPLDLPSKRSWIPWILPLLLIGAGILLWVRKRKAPGNRGRNPQTN